MDTFEQRTKLHDKTLVEMRGIIDRLTGELAAAQARVKELEKQLADERGMRNGLDELGDAPTPSSAVAEKPDVRKRKPYCEFAEKPGAPRECGTCKWYAPKMTRCMVSGFIRSAGESCKNYESKEARKAKWTFKKGGKRKSRKTVGHTRAKQAEESEG